MSSSPKDLQCIAVCEAEVSSDIQYKYHSPAEWACCRVTDSHPPTNEPCRQTLLLDGRPRLSYREHHWIAPMRLTAAQPGPWLRPVNLQPLSEQTKTDPAGPRDILPTQENHETNKNEFQSQYPPPKGGQRHRKGVKDPRGRRDSPGLSHLSGRTLSLPSVSKSTNALDTPENTHKEN